MPEAHFPRISPLRFSVKGITLLYYYSTRRFQANQIPTFRFSALLNEEATEVKLMLTS
jgi:hypothetical protein